MHHESFVPPPLLVTFFSCYFCVFLIKNKQIIVILKLEDIPKTGFSSVFRASEFSVAAQASRTVRELSCSSFHEMEICKLESFSPNLGQPVRKGVCCVCVHLSERGECVRGVVCERVCKRQVCVCVAECVCAACQSKSWDSWPPPNKFCKELRERETVSCVGCVTECVSVCVGVGATDLCAYATCPSFFSRRGVVLLIGAWLSLPKFLSSCI